MKTLTQVSNLPMLFRLYILLFLAGSLVACGLTPDDEDETAGMTVEEIYQEAKDELDRKNYTAATEMYEKLETRYPYGYYAEQAQLDIAYAYYKDNEPESAILAADRFIKLHPNHPNVDYAYYMRGLASYDTDQTLVNKIFRQDPTERDPKAGRRAFQYFSELVKRYPESKYSSEAIKRMYTIRDGLAGYELHVIDYYMRRKAYVAVVNRAKYILGNYQGTPSIPDALGLMVRAYHELGLDDLAMDSMKVLELNFPEHKVTKDLNGYLPQETTPGA